jgi:hypothetical protein
VRNASGVIKVTRFDNYFALGFRSIHATENRTAKYSTASATIVQIAAVMMELRESRRF